MPCKDGFLQIQYRMRSKKTENRTKLSCSVRIGKGVVSITIWDTPDLELECLPPDCKNASLNLSAWILFAMARI
jgi:hypothetical protein